VSLTFAPELEMHLSAVSYDMYSWTSPKSLTTRRSATLGVRLIFSDNISVVGQNIHIPVSAGSALRCMRSPDKTRTLWIDCVCINQNNEHEKTHQVSLMADIFQRSCRTLAHLGDDDENTARRAFDGLFAIAKAWLESYYGKKEADNKHSKIADLEIQNWSSLRETIDLMAIKAIMEKPYFK
jgi:hypothetical protein